MFLHYNYYIDSDNRYHILGSTYCFDSYDEMAKVMHGIVNTCSYSGLLVPLSFKEVPAPKSAGYNPRVWIG